ncbi:MAG: T9SS type A sorting domain-containing protein [Chitinophagales bacterium]
MQRKILLSLVICLISQFTQAQFIKTYFRGTDRNVRFAAIAPVSTDPSSDIYIVGSYLDGIFVSRLDASGNYIWNKKINVGDTSFTMNQMIVDSDGNLVVAGTAISGENGRGFVFKFNTTTKKLIWFQRATNNTFFWDVTEMGDGGNYLVGGQETGNGTGGGSDDITLVAARATGTISNFGNFHVHANESVESVLFDANTNKIYTTGRYELLTGNSRFRICLNALNDTAGLEWSKYYIKSTATSGRFYSEDMIFDDSSIVIVGTGDDNGTSANKYLWLFRTDLSGVPNFQVKYDITTAANDGVLSAIRRYAGGYILYGNLYEGSSYTDVFLMNIDLDGNVIWAKSYPFRTHLPTTGLYNSGAMCIVGDNIYLVGESVQDDGNLRGALMSVSIASGIVDDCGSDMDIVATINDSPFSSTASINPVACDLVFNSELPNIAKDKFKSNILCLDPMEVERNTQLFFVEDKNIVVYPNPAKDDFRVYINDMINTPYSIEVYDISGKLIMKKETDDQSTTISLVGVPAGVYLLRIANSQNAAVQSLKIVKE